MTTHNNKNNTDLSRIPIAYLILGWENNRKAAIDFFRNAESMINFVTDARMPPMTSKLDWLIREFYAAQKRGINSKLITDITKDNLTDCKDRMTFVDKMRHLRDIQFVFAVSDIEYMALVPSATREEGYLQFIYSDSESVVEIKQLIFNALYARAIPAQRRINELEGKNEITPIPITKDNLIDRIYSCKDCRNTFVYSHEVEDHKKETGHENYREYPVV